MNKLIKSLIAILFPEYCVLCGSFGSLLCTHCLLNKFTYLALPYCPKCNGKLRGRETVHRLCRRSSSLDGIVSIFKFEKNIKKVIWSYKYQGCYLLASKLRELIKCRLTTLNWNIDYLVPLPSSQRKINQRGYDHIYLLVPEIAIKKWQGLLKKQNNKSQAQLTKQNRFFNSLQNFVVENKQEIVNKNILLIDDVVTTGNTLQSAALTLKQAGANAVFALTIAKDIRDFAPRGVEYIAK